MNSSSEHRFCHVQSAGPAAAAGGGQLVPAPLPDPLLLHLRLPPPPRPRVLQAPPRPRVPGLGPGKARRDAARHGDGAQLQEAGAGDHRGTAEEQPGDLERAEESECAPDPGPGGGRGRGRRL